MLWTNAYHLCSEDRLSLLSRGTVVAVKNMLFALLNGATLLPFRVEAAGSKQLADWLCRAKITVCLISSPLFRLLCDHAGDAAGFPALRLLRLASDSVHRADIARYKKYFCRSCVLVNGLALSETGLLADYLID